MVLLTQIVSVDWQTISEMELRLVFGGDVDVACADSNGNGEVVLVGSCTVGELISLDVQLFRPC